MARISNLALSMCLVMSSMGPNVGAFSVATSGREVAARNIIKSAAFLAPNVKSRYSSPLFMAEVADAAESAKSVLVRKPESSVELSITAPGAATKAAYDKACTEVSRSISIPGFRKGAKIPPAVIENAMAAKGGRNALRTQAIQSLLNQLLEPALKEEHNLEPIGQPSLVTPAELLADNFKPGEPIELVVRCDVWPDIEWKTIEGRDKPYSNLEGTYKRKPFNQERYDTALKDLCERYATTEVAKEGKILEMGDACVVNMEGYIAKDGEDGSISKGDPLPNAASGDNVEIILGKGRYMEGLVEGLVGASVGETKVVTVTFPQNLKDKTLAGKKAVFDVTVLETSTRSVPALDDELANKIRPGLDAEGLKDELRKAVDEQEAGQWTEARNKALADGLAETLNVEVPDTLVTNQAREKYAQMMTEFRDQGMEDAEIKKLITPENFIKYKNIQKPDIVKDFKISMAADEIARLEGIEVPSYQVEEQMEALKKEAAGEDFDEAMIRGKVESTIQRRLVFDFLAETSNLKVEYLGEEEFDDALMEKLAEDSLEREKAAVEAETKAMEGEAETSEGKIDNVEMDTITAGEEEAKVKAAVGEEAKAKKAKAQEEVKVGGEAKVNSKEDTKISQEGMSESKTDEEVKTTEESNNPTELRAASKSQEEEKVLADRYGAMDLEERAFNILVDLGMVDLSPDPDSPDYDNSADDEYVA